MVEENVLNKFVPNPKGNPNIATARKTGPLTDEGKLKSLLSTGINLYRETPLLKKIRQCDKCPLGEKLITIQVGDRLIKRTKPADCSYYEKGKTECVVPVKEWVVKVRTFHAISEQEGGLELQRAVILEALKNATTASEIETIKKGYPGFYTKEWFDISLKYLSEYNKIVSNQAGNRSQHLHVHQEKGDLAERIVNRIFPEEQKENEEGR